MGSHRLEREGTEPRQRRAKRSAFGEDSMDEVVAHWMEGDHKGIWTQLLILIIN